MKNINIKGSNYPYPNSVNDLNWGPQVTEFAEGIAEAVNEDNQTIQDQQATIDAQAQTILNQQNEIQQLQAETSVIPGLQDQIDDQADTIAAQQLEIEALQAALPQDAMIFGKGHLKVEFDESHSLPVSNRCDHDFRPSDSVPGKSHWCSKCDERK